MNLRQIRKKIKSISNVKKITKAMQLVSAVKMKKSQKLALDGLPYRSKLEKIIQQVLPLVKDDISPLLTPLKESQDRRLIIVVSTNKGLCGAFNFFLFKYLIKNFDFKKDFFVTVGKKSSLFISKLSGQIIASFIQTPFINYVSAIFQTALNQFLSGKVNQVLLVYNKFINSFQFEPTTKILLPAKFKDINLKTETRFKEEYLIEPKPELIINLLIENYVEEMIRGAIIESEAGEHSSRMMAMKNATDNAEEVIYNLSLLRNKIRQEKITYELLDMITAKESIEINS